MKEATGELNLTLVVVIMVGVLSLFFFSIMWPRLKTNFNQNTKCDEAVCTCPEFQAGTNKCIAPAGTAANCTYKGQNLTCMWKG